jgi:hypothetical protein
VRDGEGGKGYSFPVNSPAAASATVDTNSFREFLVLQWCWSPDSALAGERRRERETHLESCPGRVRVQGGSSGVVGIDSVPPTAAVHGLSPGVQTLQGRVSLRSDILRNVI